MPAPTNSPTDQHVYLCALRLFHGLWEVQT